MVQWVKDLALSLQCLGLLLWRGFSPWPKNFHMLQVWGRKKKRCENLFHFSSALFFNFLTFEEVKIKI